MDLTGTTQQSSINYLFIPSLPNLFFPRCHPLYSGRSLNSLSRNAPLAKWLCCAKPGTPQYRQHKIPKYFSYERDHPFNNHESQIKQIKLAQQHRKKGQWRLALAMILALEDDAGHLTSYLTEYIHLQSLRTLDKYPNATALDIYTTLVDFISESKARPSVVTYNAILCALQKRITGKLHFAQDTLDVAFRVLDQIERRSLKPDEFSFSLVYRLCALAKDPHYLSLFERRAVKTLGHVGGKVAGSSLVCARTKLGDIDGADAVVTDMSSRGAALNERGYSCLISTAYHSGKHARVIELFRSIVDTPMLPLDSYLFSNILGSCSNAGDPLNARLAVGTMEKRNIPITAAILERTFLTSLRCRDVQLGFDVIFHWGKLCAGPSSESEKQVNRTTKNGPSFPSKKQGSGEPQRISLPNPSGYCTRLLTAIGRWKGIDDARVMVAYIWKIINRMDSEVGLEVDTLTLNAAASSLTKLGYLGDAKRMIEEDIPRRSLKPDVVSYNVLIRTLGSSGHTSQAVEVLNTMQEYGLLPDQGIFNSLLQIATRSGDAKLGAVVLNEIQRNPSLKIDNITASTILTGMRKARDGAAALRLHSGIVASGQTLDAKAYGLLLTTLYESGDRSAAIGVFGWLLIQKLQPQKIFFNVMIHHAGKRQGGYEEAELLFRGMKKRGVMADEITYTTMVQLCARHGHVDRAFRLVSEMQDLGLAMSNTFVWTALIDGCGRAGMWERGIDVLKMMRRVGNTSSSLVPRPTIACYNAALYAAGTQGENWPSALEIFQALLTDETVTPSIVSYSSMASIILKHRFEVREIGVVEKVWKMVDQIIEVAVNNNGRWEGQVVDETTLKRLRSKSKRLEWIVKLKGQYVRGQSTGDGQGGYDNDGVIYNTDVGNADNWT